MGEFCNIISFEQHSDGWPAVPVGVIGHMAKTGKAGRFVHYIGEGFPQWDVLCALEDALVENDQEKGWMFAVGSMAEDIEVRGWLEYEDWILVPYGPVRKGEGGDIGIWARDDFNELDVTLHAFSPVAADSAIHLNKIVRAIHGKPIGTDGTV